MAHFGEVLIRLEGEGIRVQREAHSIVLRFPSTISRNNLVAFTADIMRSEELPFNGYYAIMEDGEEVVLDISNFPEFPTKNIRRS